nr:prolipoprotein diacylglyceryl transferase [Candidatus Omnitrophota bacterium]
PLKVFAVWEGGLIFYGGAITAVLGLWAFVREKKIPFLRALDFIVPYGVLTHAFGRIGCFLNGCCYGKTCALPWAVTFPGMTHPVHPTQLYEAFYNFALAFFLIRRRQNPHFEGQIALLYFLLYGFGRYLLEFLREPAWTRWGLTANQWLSMVIIVVAFLLFPIARKKTR